LWTGQTTSRLGDSLHRIALAWWVLEKTGSATAMGTVLVLSQIPLLLFLLVGGVVVDRFPRIRIRTCCAAPWWCSSPCLPGSTCWRSGTSTWPA
jgi:hypothetical protein